jgi:hypothetical protein
MATKAIENNFILTLGYSRQISNVLSWLRDEGEQLVNLGARMMEERGCEDEG